MKVARVWLLAKWEAAAAAHTCLGGDLCCSHLIRQQLCLHLLHPSFAGRSDPAWAGLHATQGPSQCYHEGPLAVPASVPHWVN